MADKKRVLHIPAGALVLWDSRTFHQNQYGKEKSEERIVQYVSFLPKHSSNNTEVMKTKRLKYFNDRRTTSHWAYPIRVNGLQPQTYGDNSWLINYDLLKEINLGDLEEKIKEII